MSDGAQREMTLFEYVSRLPSNHRARMKYREIMVTLHRMHALCVARDKMAEETSGQPSKSDITKKIESAVQDEMARE